jgi:hypothetical protein
MATGVPAEQQLRQAADVAWKERWHFVADMNGDGVTTISDVWLWLKWAFFAPADWLLLITMYYATSVALFLEMTPSMLSGRFSGITSGFFWLIALAIAKPN